MTKKKKPLNECGLSVCGTLSATGEQRTASIPAAWFYGVIIISLFLSGLVIGINHNPINVDGILYLEVSQVFWQQGWHAAMAIYPWPWYAMLVATVHHLLHTPLLLTALWLNTLFLTLAIVFLLAILQKCRVSRTVWWWGAACLLLYPQLNHLRLFVIRDAGYWACLLGGFYSLWCYWQTPRWRYAAGWGIGLALATLFRIEGSVIWIMLPFVLFSDTTPSWRERGRRWLQSNSILLFSLLIAASTVIYIAIYHPHYHLPIGRLADLWQYASTWRFILQHLWHWQLWERFFSDFANAFTGLYLILLIYAFYGRLLPVNQIPVKLISAFVGLNFLIPLFFYSYSDIVVARYLMPLCLILSLVLPFACVNLYQRAWQPRIAFSRYYRVLGSIFLLAFSIQAVSGIIPFGYSKAYITEAGYWLATHTPPQAPIYSNSREVLFYADRSTLDWEKISAENARLAPLENGQWKNYRYLAIRLNAQGDTALRHWVTAFPLKPIQIFANKRHDQVLIYVVPR